MLETEPRSELLDVMSYFGGCHENWCFSAKSLSKCVKCAGLATVLSVLILLQEPILDVWLPTIPVPHWNRTEEEGRHLDNNNSKCMCNNIMTSEGRHFALEPVIRESVATKSHNQQLINMLVLWNVSVTVYINNIWHMLQQSSTHIIHSG